MTVQCKHMDKIIIRYSQYFFESEKFDYMYYKLTVNKQHSYINIRFIMKHSLGQNGHFLSALYMRVGDGPGINHAHFLQRISEVKFPAFKKFSVGTGTFNYGPVINKCADSCCAW